MLLDVCRVVASRQCTHPRVEELDGRRPGLDLDTKEGSGDLGEAGAEVYPPTVFSDNAFGIDLEFRQERV